MAISKVVPTALTVLLLVALVLPLAMAAPAPNKGSEVSAEEAADAAKQNANENAAFNRAASKPTVTRADCVYAIYYETDSDYENDVNGILMGPIIPSNSPDGGFVVTGVLFICGEVTFE